MFKAFVLASSLTAALCGAATLAHARQVSVWGNNFTVDEPTAVAPRPPRFDALAGERQQGGQQPSRLRELEDELTR